MQELFKTATLDPSLPLLIENISESSRPIVDAALELTRTFGQHFRLDLSPESAASLDAILLQALSDSTLTSASLLRNVSSYFAALLLEHANAEAVPLEPFPILLRLYSTGGSISSVYTSPLRMAIDAWENRRPQFAEALDGLLKAEDIEFDRPLFVPAYPAPDDYEDEAIWSRAQSLQIIFGQFEEGTWNLTYIPHNLRFVDHYLTRELSPLQAFRLASLSEDEEVCTQWLIQATAAFFGEMARQHLNVRWVDPERGPLEMTMEANGTLFSPLKICMDALVDRSSYPLLRAYKGLLDFKNLPIAEMFPLAEEQISADLLLSTGIRALARPDSVDEGQTTEMNQILTAAPEASPATTEMDRIDQASPPTYEMDVVEFGATASANLPTPSVLANLKELEREQGSLDAIPEVIEEFEDPVEEPEPPLEEPKPLQKPIDTSLASKLQLLVELSRRAADGEALDVDATQMVDVSLLRALQRGDAEVAELRQILPGDPEDDKTTTFSHELITLLKRQGILESSTEQMPAKNHDEVGDTVLLSETPSYDHLPTTLESRSSDDAEADRTVEVDRAQLLMLRSKSQALKPLPDPVSTESDDYEDQTRNIDQSKLLATLEAMRAQKTAEQDIERIDPDATSQISVEQLAAVRAHLMLDTNQGSATTEEQASVLHYEENASTQPLGRLVHAPQSLDFAEEGSTQKMPEELQQALKQSIGQAPASGPTHKISKNLQYELNEALKNNPPSAHDFDAPTVQGSDALESALLQIAERDAQEPDDGTMALSAIISSSGGTMSLAGVTPYDEHASTEATGSNPSLAVYVLADDDDFEEGDLSEPHTKNRRSVSGRYSPLVITEERTLKNIPSPKNYPTRLLSMMSRLVPILVPHDWEGLEQTSSRALLLNSPVEHLLPRIAVAIDKMGQLQYICPDDLASWGCTFQELCDLAEINLEHRPLDPNHLIHSQVEGLDIHQVDTGGNFEAALLLTPRLGRLADAIIGTDTLWIGIPNRHTLLMASAQGTHAQLQTFAGVVRYYHDTQPSSLCAEIFYYGPPGPRLQNTLDI